MRRIILLIITSIILTLTAIPGEAKENKIYIGILPYYAPDKIWHFYRPFISYLNKETGLKWDLKLYHSYDAMVEGICSNEVSIAYLGPVPLGLAREMCKVRPLLVVLGADGKPFYNSIIFTGNKGINSLKDLRGKAFAFGDRNSTSSTVVPRKMLGDEGITMNMIKPLFMKSHEKIIEAVAKNKAIAGATKVSVFEKFREMGFKILKVSEPIPHHCFCTVNINTDMEKKFINALIKLNPSRNPSDRNIIRNWDPELQHGFTIPPDDYIIRVLELQGLFKKYND